MDFISIPNSAKPSNAPTPNRTEVSPAPSQGVTPSFSGSIAGGPSTTSFTTASLQSIPAGSFASAGGSSLGLHPENTSEANSLAEMKESLQRSGAAVEALRQMDLWSLVLDLITRIQHGTVTAKTVDNEAGIIRARISKAKQSLKQVSGLDTSIGEQEEEIMRLQEAIEKKKDLLLRFQAVMGAGTSPDPVINTKIIKSEESEQDPKVKEESVDPITHETNDKSNDAKIDDKNTDENSEGIANNNSTIDVFMSDFNFLDNKTAPSTEAEKQNTEDINMPDLDFGMPDQQQNSTDFFNNLSLENFDM